VLASLAVIALISARTTRGCAWAMGLAGAGAALLNCGTTVLMPRVFFDSNPVASANLGFLFVGLGALVTPVVANLLLQLQPTTGFQRALGLFALACLSPVLIAIFSPSEITATPSALHLDVLARPSLWLTGIVFVLYTPLEGWLSAAAPTYLKRTGFTERAAAMALTVTWLAFLSGRFVLAYWQQAEVLSADSSHMVVLVLALIAAVALGNLVGTHKKDAIAFWFFLVGLALGPIFSSLVGFLLMSFDPQEHGMAYGTMFAIGTAGSLLLGPLVNPSEKPEADRKVLWLLAGTSLALIAVMLAAWVTR
jgi:fucose permease